MARTWNERSPFSGTLGNNDFLYGQIAGEPAADAEVPIPIPKLLEIITLRVAYDGGAQIDFIDDKAIVYDVTNISDQNDTVLEIENANLPQDTFPFKIFKTGLHRQQPVDLVERGLFVSPGVLPFRMQQIDGTLYIADTSTARFTIATLDNAFAPTVVKEIIDSASVGEISQVTEHAGVIYAMGNVGITLFDKNTHSEIISLLDGTSGVKFAENKGFIFQGEIMYVSVGNDDSIAIIDFSNKQLPVVFDKIDSSSLGVGVLISNPHGLAFYNENLFVANRLTNQLTIVQIPGGDPSQPLLVAEIEDGDTSGIFTWELSNVEVMEISGTLGFTAGVTFGGGGTYTAALFNVADSPFDILSQFSLPAEPQQVVFNNQYLLVSYIGAGNQLLSLFDISDPENPELVRHFVDSDFSVTASEGLAVRGNEIYLGVTKSGPKVLVLSLEGMIVQSIAAGSANFGTLDAKTAQVSTLEVTNTLAAANAVIGNALSLGGPLTSQARTFPNFAYSSPGETFDLDFKEDFAVQFIENPAGLGTPDVKLGAKNIRVGARMILVFDNKSGSRTADFSTNFAIMQGTGKVVIPNNQVSFIFIDCVKTISNTGLPTSEIALTVKIHSIQ